jgi:hypothetical protein
VDERAEGSPAGAGRRLRGGVPGEPRHNEPPETTWLLPELEDGEEPELRPPELLELLELDPVEFEPVELEPVLPEPVELEPEPVEPEPVEPEPVEPEPVEPEPELVEPEPELVEPVEALACVDPGRTRANAPAAATLATATAVVAERTLSRPRSLAATARWIPSRSGLLMSPIQWSRIRRSLREPSR